MNSVGHQNGTIRWMCQTYHSKLQNKPCVILAFPDIKKIRRKLLQLSTNLCDCHQTICTISEWLDTPHVTHALQLLYNVSSCFLEMFCTHNTVPHASKLERISSWPVNFFSCYTGNNFHYPKEIPTVLKQKNSIISWASVLFYSAAICGEQV